MDDLLVILCSISVAAQTETYNNGKYTRVVRNTIERINDY